MVLYGKILSSCKKKEKEKNVMACRELMRSQKQDFDICVLSY